MRLTVFCADSKCGGQPTYGLGKTLYFSNIRCPECGNMELTTPNKNIDVKAYACMNCGDSTDCIQWEETIGCPFCSSNRFAVLSTIWVNNESNKDSVINLLRSKKLI